MHADPGYEIGMSGSSTVAGLAVEIALAEAAAGVFERDNDNRGDRVDEYQQSTSGGSARPGASSSSTGVLSKPHVA